MSGGSTAKLRRTNRDKVLQEIIFHAPVSRTTVAKKTGLTGAAVSRITRELIDAGLIEEGKAITVKGQVGRRNITLELAANGAYILGVVLTATIQALSIGNSRGDVIEQKRIKINDLSKPEAVIKTLCEAAGEMITSANIDQSRLIGCGVAVGGVVDAGSGTLIRSDPLSWTNVPLGSLFKKFLNIPVKCEGRAVAILTAEHKGGVAKDIDNIVLISNGLWVGGAMVLDGRLIKGQNNMIGQIGHFRVPDNTSSCDCGRKGCLDVSASGRYILSKLDNTPLEIIENPREQGKRLRCLTHIYEPDRKQLNTVFRQAGENMGYAIDAILSMLDPEMILLSGAAHRQPEFIIGIQNTLANLRPGEKDWPIRVSDATSNQAAIWLGLDAFLYSRSLDIEQLKIGK